VEAVSPALKTSASGSSTDDLIRAVLTRPAEPDRTQAPDRAPRRLAPRGSAFVAAAAALTGAVVVLASSPGAGLVAGAAVLSAWAVSGIVLTIRRPDERLGVLASVGALIGAVAVVAAWRIGRASGNQAGAELARDMALGLLPAVGLHLLAGLPEGHLESQGARRGVAGAYLAGALVGVGLTSGHHRVPAALFVAWAAVAGVIALAASSARYRRTAGLVRRRLQWFGVAMAVTTEVALVAIALRILVAWPSHLGIVVALTTIVLPLALAVAAASDRVAGGADRLLAHTVSVAGISGVVVAVYLLVVIGLGRSPARNERTLLLLSMLAAGIAAALYLPARQRLERWANNLVYGERHAPDEVLRTFGSRLSRSIPLDELLLQLAESLQKVLNLRAAEVWTGSSERLERTVSVPDRPASHFGLSSSEAPVVSRAGVSGPAWMQVWLPQLLGGREDAVMRVAPVVHSGELLALIVAERAPGADAFTEEDERVLTELARQIGLALHNVNLDSALQASLDEVRRQAQELRDSRSRIVATADAARRQIERNLHDGAQQHLVAMALQMKLARQLAGTDAEAAQSMLDELSENLKEAIQDLRDLAHGIYPPLLMDRGLAEALAAAGRRAALPTNVRVETDGRFGQEIEAAVYFCCLEGMQNAGKHAGEGSTIEVRVWEDEGALLFEVSDDGAGFAYDNRVPGAGFINMSDRLGAIGGSLRVESAPGTGSRIQGTIPIEPSPT
jgi:signal transduction histidine kinase